jgi:hypothetical protein
MAKAKRRVIAVGEVLLKLSRGTDGRFGPSCSGDTFNTAIYLARAERIAAVGQPVGDAAEPASVSVVRTWPRQESFTPLGASC